ncbi:MAG: transposase [Candidatus Uhrbacteria bacterium]
MQYPQRKQIRLAADQYRDPNATASLTITIRDRHPIFQKDVLAATCYAAIAIYTRQFEVPMYAWTLMPDHAHFCLSATPRRSITQIVSDVKQLTTRIAWEHGENGIVWQRSFFDHFLRKDENVEVVCRYIWNNAVRAGIVSDWRDYSYNGSTVYDLTRV